MIAEKILWVVNYNDLSNFVNKALAVRASGVAIRTDCNLDIAIPEFHKHGINVYGWRWPSAKKDAAMQEAYKAAKLLSNGMDGYFVDPEGAKGKPWDWDLSGLDSLADEFCDTIKSSAKNKPFGITSHYLAKKAYPRLPWASFFKYADVFLPQAYWRTEKGVIGHGIPDDNFRVSKSFWANAGAPLEKIFPMAGELGFTKASEISLYSQEAHRQQKPITNFYAYNENVSPAVWDAVSKA